MRQWIVFDAMGVVFEEPDDVVNLLVPFLHRRGFALDPKKVHSIYRRASLGEISSRDFWESLGLGGEYPAIENEYLDTCLQLDPHFLETAALLSGRFSLALLSNDIAEWSAHLRRRHGLDKLFRISVISSEVGFRKPAPEIYYILLDRLQADGKDCLFVDDRAENLAPAAALGIIPVWLAKGGPSPVSGHPHSVQDLLELPRLIENNFSNPS